MDHGVYIKGERSLPGNYRPISLLSIFDKILEKLMYRRLINFLEQTVHFMNISLDLGKIIQQFMLLWKY